VRHRVAAGLGCVLAPLRAVHNLDFSRMRRHGDDPLTDEQRHARPPVDHPVIRTHVETGRKVVFLRDHAESVVGMDYEVERALIEEVNAMIIHDDIVYRHRWSPGQRRAVKTPV